MNCCLDIPWKRCPHNLAHIIRLDKYSWDDHLKTCPDRILETNYTDGDPLDVARLQIPKPTNTGSDTPDVVKVSSDYTPTSAPRRIKHTPA